MPGCLDQSLYVTGPCPWWRMRAIVAPVNIGDDDDAVELNVLACRVDILGSN